MFRPACLYLDIDNDVYKISVFMTAILTLNGWTTQMDGRAPVDIII